LVWGGDDAAFTRDPGDESYRVLHAITRPLEISPQNLGDLLNDGRRSQKTIPARTRSIQQNHVASLRMQEGRDVDVVLRL
jgi:hypothetical protein